MFQGLLKSKAFVSTFGALMAAYVRFIKATSTVVEDPPNFIQKNRPDHPLIIAMWHGQGLLFPFLRPRKDIKVAVMVAKHIDGDIAHASLVRFGMTTIRGSGSGRKSKDKGGFAALRASMMALRSDTTVALTADIPPGPARKASLGLVILSKMSGRAIIPGAVVTKHYLKLNTWSGFTVNLPFSKIVIAGGDQIHVPRHADDEELEALRQKLQDSMEEVTARAYRVAGTRERGEASEDDPVGFGLSLRFYVWATRQLQPTASLLLNHRRRQGKEEPGRMTERFGVPSAPRLTGPLLWMHASSVGETMVILHLVERLMDQRPDLQILLTTATVTSAKLARTRLPEGATHQYIPLDTPDFMMRFFDHWRPDAVILTESEIWPNLIREARTRDVPLLLVNGRISPRSFRRWRKHFKIARPLFSSLDLVLAQNDRYAGNFERLGARNVLTSGNLKMDAPPPPVDNGELRRLKKAIGSRPVFLAASTHKGEEEIVASVHQTLKKNLPEILTIIVPRHPDRAVEICDLLKARGIKYIERSRCDAPAASHDIYVADTIGELGLFYALSPVAFVGGSLVPHGGQNPIEAILHGTAVLTGPQVHNFKEAYAALLKADACIEIGSAQELAAKARKLLKNKKERKKLVTRARAAVAGMRGALDATVEALSAYLPAKKEQRRAS